MARLIYCKDKADIEAHATAMDYVVMRGDQLPDAIRALKMGQNVYATLRSASIGWKPPTGTVVLFTCRAAMAEDMREHVIQAATRGLRVVD